MKKPNRHTARECNIEELRGRLFLVPREVASLLRIGDNKAYDMLKDDNNPFPVLRSGRVIRIPTKHFFEWYDKL